MVISTRKKSTEVVTVNPYIGSREIAAQIRHLFDSPMDVQADEQWSYVARKTNPRWLWYAIDTATGCILSFVFGQRKEDVCEQLIAKLRVFNSRTYHTDDWPSYAVFIPANQYVVSNKYTEKIENKNLLLRTRIKRLPHKTICFSKFELLPDGVIGLFINRHCFQLNCPNTERLYPVICSNSGNDCSIVTEVII
ncbi:insertion element IS1 protein InsB [Methylocaldum szegediense]|uniref:Insertion element IS1 protein InsB n=1 Tax=Methylocaldum szegediense TaxID=73780 RepID=A0ABN8X7K7_9GAMM|nr:IS1 family transposase [Methylocaldum szegediense]CAI8926427.1 insertion element IS1 protein InsB [Methylocaldum szegediense]